MTATILSRTRRSTTPEIHIPAEAGHLEGFCRWVGSSRLPEKASIQFIDGVIEVDMNPEEIFSHGSPKKAVTVGLDLWTGGENLGEVFIDRTLLVNADAGLAVEPDVMFCRWETLESGRAQLRETQPGSGRYVELVGTPDLVVEIISRSSVTKDTVTLKQRYAQAGIPEYWLIDCRGRNVRFDVLSLRKTTYRKVPRSAEGVSHSPLFGVDVQLTRKKSPINTWQYRLQMG
jgi:Uma2 family endonuclease